MVASPARGGGGAVDGDHAAGRWFVSLLCQDVILDLPAANTAVGIDARLDSLLTLSTGEKLTNPRHERADRARLTRAHRNLSRKENGSNNYWRRPHDGVRF